MTHDDLPSTYTTGVVLATGAAACTAVWLTVAAIGGLAILAGRVYEARTQRNARGMR
jgi:hypothetical protein